MSLEILKELEKDKESLGVSEFIVNRLYFVTFKNKTPQETPTIHYFTVDDDLEKLRDSEQLNLASIAIRYFQTINNKLASPDLESKVLVSYSCGSEKRRSDSAILIGVYALLHLKLSPEDISSKLTEHTAIKQLDSLNAVQKVVQLGLINFDDFNIDDFNSLNRKKLKWFVPNKILQFSGPLPITEDQYLPPRKYVKYFLESGVSTIVRLSHVKYDANPFVGSGLEHFDLNMDSTVPSELVLSGFLEICEKSEGAIVVHCRDILGRACSLISAYLVKHYCLSAGEAIAWVRICSCDYLLESQKNWLKEKEDFLLKTGKSYRLQHFGSTDKLPQHDFGICSYTSRWGKTESHITNLQEGNSLSKNDLTQHVKGLSSNNPNPTNSCSIN